MSGGSDAPVDPPSVGHEPIPHTADCGIRIWAPTPEALFEEAGRALMEILIDSSPVALREEVAFDVEGDDWADLLRAYLAELCYRFSADGMVFGRFAFPRLEPTRAEAVAEGERFDPERHVLETEIKAVTYHQLRMEPVGDHWEAQVIFDL